MTNWPSQLTKVSAVTTASTPVAGEHNAYDASAGPLAPSLPSLTSGTIAAALQAGQLVRLKVAKSRSDQSRNRITLTCAQGDTFDSGATSQVLQVPGEKITVFAQTVGNAAAPTWVVEEHSAPVDMLDMRFGALFATSASGTRFNNVMSAEFGAHGDNVSDDTVAVQKAIDAGGIIYFPPGNYKVGHLVLHSGTILFGVNAGAPGIIPGAGQRSCLRRVAGSTGPILDIPAGAGVGHIRGLEVDGMQLPGTLLSLGDFAGGEEAQWKFDDLYLHDAAITAGGFTDGDGVYVGNNRRAATFRNVQAYNNGRYGFNIQASDTKWEHCSTGSNGWDGWWINGGATRISGGDNYGNGAAAAAIVSSSVASVSAAGTSPTTIGTTAPHGLKTGMRALITGAGGVQGQVNMVYPVTVVDASTFTIPTTNNSAWTNGGTVRPYANGVWQAAGAGTSLVGVGVDRNQFSGIGCDLNCGNITITGCILTSNGQQAAGAYANIEVNDQNGRVTILGTTFQPQATGYPNKPQCDVMTRNSSSWKDVSNIPSGATSVTSGKYTNYDLGIKAFSLMHMASGTSYEIETADNGTTWTYAGTAVTAKPTLRTDLRTVFVAYVPTATTSVSPPAWATSKDRLVLVPSS